jgi:uncharacterized protein
MVVPVAQSSREPQILGTDRDPNLPSVLPIEALILDITARLVQEFNPEAIFLFGSHVWGIPNADSDLDLLIIVTQSELSSSKRSSLMYHCLRDILYPLDILFRTRAEIQKFTQIPLSLEYQILTRGKLLYGHQNW